MSVMPCFSFRAWQSSPIRPWVKGLAGLLVLALVFPELSWAFERPNWLMPQGGISLLSPFLELPDSLGKVISAVPGREATVIIIQDLHCHYDAQDHIAGIIDFLAEHHGLRLVGLEGASLPVNVTKLSTFPVPAVKEAVGRMLLKSGEMSGPEFYAATGRYPVTLSGIENPALYRAERERVDAFLNRENSGLLADLWDAFEELKPKVYNPTLLMFDANKSRFRSGNLSLYQYVKTLDNGGRQFNLAMANFPQMGRYLAAGTAEIGPAVDASLLIAELEELDGQIRERLYQQPVERELSAQLLRLEQLEKLLNIGATPADLKVIRSQPGNYAAKSFLDFIASNGNAPEAAAGIQELDRAFAQALAFYDIADRRSLAFAENVLARMQEQKVKLAVLVTGGYHTPIIMEQLQRQGIATIAISPRLNPLDSDNPYLALLQNSRSPLERLLAQSQNAMMKEPYFEPARDTAAILNEKALGPRQWRYQALEFMLKLGLTCLLLEKSAGTLDLDKLQAAFDQKLHPRQASKTSAGTGYAADSGSVTLNLSEGHIKGNGLVVPVTLHPGGEKAGTDARNTGACFTTFFPEKTFATNGAPVSPIADLHVGGMEATVYPNSMLHGVEETLSRQARPASLKSVPIGLEDGWIPQGMEPVSSASLMASFALLPNENSSSFQKPTLVGKLARLFLGITSLAGVTGWIREMGNNLAAVRMRGALFLLKRLEQVQRRAQAKGTLPTNHTEAVAAAAVQVPKLVLPAAHPENQPVASLQEKPAEGGVAGQKPTVKPETIAAVKSVNPVSEVLKTQVKAEGVPARHPGVKAGKSPVKLFQGLRQFVPLGVGRARIAQQPSEVPGAQAKSALPRRAHMGHGLRQVADGLFQRIQHPESRPLRWGQWFWNLAGFFYATGARGLGLLLAFLPEKGQRLDAALNRFNRESGANCSTEEFLDLHSGAQSLIQSALAERRSGTRPFLLRPLAVRTNRWLYPLGRSQREGAVSHLPETAGLNQDAVFIPENWLAIALRDPAREQLSLGESLQYLLITPLVLQSIRRQAARLESEPGISAAWMLGTTVTSRWLQTRSPRTHMLAVLAAAARRYPDLPLAEDARQRLLRETEYPNDKQLIIQMVVDSLAAHPFLRGFDHLPAVKKAETLELLQWLLQRLEPGNSVKTPCADAVLGPVSFEVPRAAQERIRELLKQIRLEPGKPSPRRQLFLSLMTSA